MSGRLTRSRLRADLEALGLASGDTVMVHAALRSVGGIVGGPDALIDAIIAAISPGGTILAYTDWEAGYWSEEHPNAHLKVLRVPDDIRSEVVAFDPAGSRAARDNGAFMELLRTRPGARRSANPGASCAALGSRAEWLTADHPLDYGYGPGSPFAKFVESRGSILLLGCPRDRITILHHAEHLARIPGKRITRYEAPLRVDNGGMAFRWIEEFETSDPVVEGLDEDYFRTIVEEYLANGHGRTGRVGNADCVLVPAADIVPFAVAWLEKRFPPSPG